MNNTARSVPFSIEDARDRLIVLLHGSPVADLVTLQGKGMLIYRSPLNRNFCVSASMPPCVEPYSGPILDNWIWNLLPDNPQTLRWIARDTGNGAICSDKNPFKLIAKIGEECSGSIQIVRPDRLSSLNPGDVLPLCVTDVELRLKDARRGKNPFGIPMDEEGAGGYFSLAGAQPKLALRKTRDGWAAVSGAQPTSHILKPPMRDLPGQIEGEHFCLALARLCNLPAAQSEIVRFGNETAIAVERFDRRRGKDDSLQRIHVEDMCQALGISPQNKYQSDGGPGIIEISRFLRHNSAIPDNDIEIFFRSCLFNWLIGGTDAHAKNYSVFLVEGKSILAPLYDINTYLPYTDNIPHIRLSMSVEKYYKFGQISIRHWQKAAQTAGMPVEFNVIQAILEMAMKIGVNAVPLAHTLANNNSHADREALLQTATAITIRMKMVIESLQKECSIDPK